MFIDGSIKLIKCVMLDVYNKKSPIPILIGKFAKETYKEVSITYSN